MKFCDVYLSYIVIYESTLIHMMYQFALSSSNLSCSRQFKRLYAIDADIKREM